MKININLDKIDQTQIYKGQKGNYLDAKIIMNEKPDQYGNIGFIVQSISEIEFKAGKKGNIIGNIKHTNTKQNEQQKQGSSSSTSAI
jgi:hypothetical protein